MSMVSGCCSYRVPFVGVRVIAVVTVSVVCQAAIAVSMSVVMLAERHSAHGEQYEDGNLQMIAVRKNLSL